MSQLDTKSESKPGDIPIMLETLFMSIDALDKRTGDLLLKIGPVLAPPSDNAKPTSVRSSITELGTKIGNATDRIQTITDRIYEATERVEV